MRFKPHSSHLRLFLLFLGIASIGPAAWAQDFNLEARSEAFAPKVVDTTSAPSVERRVVTQPAIYGETTVQVRLTDEQQMDVLARKRGVAKSTLRAQAPAELDAMLATIPKTITKKVPRLIRPARVIVEEKPKPRSVDYFFSANTGYGYDTNANNSRANAIADSIASASAAFRTQIPVGAGADALNLVIGSSSVRYDKLTVQDFDQLTGNAVYGHEFGSTAGSTKTASADTAIKNILNVGIEGRSVHERGYGIIKGQFLTPSVSLARSNMPLSDALCGDVGKERFCHSGTLSVAARYVFADVASREYAATKIAGKITFLGDIKGLVFNATGSMDFKQYTNFPGGRRDIVYVAGGDMEWKINSYASLAAGITFTQQTSTFAAAEWNGFSMGPQLKFVAKLN